MALIGRYIYKPLLSATVFMIGFGLNAQAGSVALTDSSRVSLLTCSPGEELYSIFGHSAIRVADPALGLDIVFNYGTFDFNDPNFYTNFVTGKLNYILSVSHFHNFYLSYAQEDRWIYEQKLNIDRMERQKLLDSLLINYLPENRYYLYDFFYDNCATRIRDIFVEALPRKIDFHYDSLAPNQSFRQLLMPFLSQKSWARLGINLLLGLPSDKKATPWEYMYLPDHMLTVFKFAKFEATPNSFAQTPEVLLVGSSPKQSAATNYPLVFSFLILVVVAFVSFFNLKSSVIWLWLDRILLLLVGLLGVLLAIMWFFTDHQSMAFNLNILWANPFHVAIALLLSKRLLVWWYGLVNIFILAILAIAWPFLPQQLPWEMYPIVLALLVRFALLALRSRREKAA